MKRWFLLLTMPALLLWSFPCHGSNSAEGSISIMEKQAAVRITTRGHILVGDRQTSLKKLARQLRREGFKPDQTIRVSIPPSIPKRALIAISRELASKGYRKVLFSKPPKAIAETKDAMP